jgi:hypothetical protein
MEAKMRRTIDGSTGVDASKAGEGLDLAEERAKWVEEWGEAEAEKMMGLVLGAMEDYEFLRSKRVRLDGSGDRGD